jgi:hypothetical protein
MSKERTEKYATNLELQAMIIGRDVLIEKIFTLLGQEVFSELWRKTILDLDNAILGDGLDLEQLIDEAYDETDDGEVKVEP